MVSARNGHKDLCSSERKATGAHYTPLDLASFVAKQIVQTVRLTHDSRPIRILDPAVGDGELLNALLEQLPDSILKRVIVSGFDTDSAALSAAQQRLSQVFPSTDFNLLNEDFLFFVAEHYLNSQWGLFSPTAPFFDIVIANPPYVRTQVLGAMESQRLSKMFGLTGRVDLYHAFLESIALVLKENGIAGIICSNRFMTTRSGITVRQKLSEKFKVFHIWDLGDTRLFEAAVLPAVLLLSKKNSAVDTSLSRFTSIYTAAGIAELKAKTPIAALNYNGLVTVDRTIFRVRHGFLDYLKNPISAWTLSNAESDDWLGTVSQHTHCTFSDVGKIRVGVKTTADKIFIRDDWDTFSHEKRPELLLPLVTHYVAERFRVPPDAVCPKILYTHKVVDGKRTVIDLVDYPNSRHYLNEHREALEKRHYVIEAGRKWYEIWVPQNPDAWGGPKLIFPDISEKPTFFIDLGGAVVNGDCYWITPTKKDDLDLLWLAMAVGNSSFIEEFYDHKFNNKLYAGRRRFMTQYVEQFPLPDPETKLSREVIAKTKKIYDALNLPSEKTNKLIAELDELVWISFGLMRKEALGKRDLQLPVQNTPAKLRKPRKKISAGRKVKVAQPDSLSFQLSVK